MVVNSGALGIGAVRALKVDADALTIPKPRITSPGYTQYRDQSGSSASGAVPFPSQQRQSSFGNGSSSSAAPVSHSLTIGGANVVGSAGIGEANFNTKLPRCTSTEEAKSANKSTVGNNAAQNSMQRWSSSPKSGLDEKSDVQHGDVGHYASEQPSSEGAREQPVAAVCPKSTLANRAYRRNDTVERLSDGQKSAREECSPCRQESVREGGMSSPDGIMYGNTRLAPFIRRLTANFNQPELADVVLVVDGEEFPSHRVLLSAHSEYFERLFLSSCPERGTSSSERISEDGPMKIIELAGMHSEVVRCVLRILYFDATPADILREDPKRAIEVLALACQWMLWDIKEGVLEYTDMEIRDVDVLTFLVENCGFSNEQMELRVICERNCKKHFEEQIYKAELQKRKLNDKEGTASLDSRRGGRWPTPTGVGRRVDNWSTPVRTPRAIGW